MTSHNRSGVGGEPLVRTPAPSSQHRTPVECLECGDVGYVMVGVRYLEPGVPEEDWQPCEDCPPRQPEVSQ